MTVTLTSPEGASCLPGFFIQFPPIISFQCHGKYEAAQILNQLIFLQPDNRPSSMRSSPLEVQIR